MQTLRLTALAAFVLLNSAGCAVYTDKEETDRVSDNSYKSLQSRVSDSREAVSMNAKRAAQDVDRPYITGKSRPLSRDVTLPLPLRGGVDTTLLYRDDGDLLELARRIQDATGILVKVTPDALLPLDAFMPRLNEDSKTERAPIPNTASLDSTIALDSPLPTEGGISSGPSRVRPITTIPHREQPLRPAGKQPLPSVLDAVALRLGVYWKYDAELGGIVFYRTETRTFEVRNAEMAASSKMSLGLSGGVSQNNTSGLTSRSESSINLPEESKGPMDGIVSRASQFMTKAGKITAGANGTLVVTDTKSALDQINEYISQENRMRSRRIEFVFEEITVEKNSSAQAAVEWDAIFVGSGSGNAVNINGITSIIDKATAVNVGAKVGSGQWQGSSVSMQALSKIGKVVDRKINTFGSNNGQPATAGRPERQKYISELQQTQSYSKNSAPTVSVNQAEEVSGRILTVLPYAYPDGEINLTVKYDNTPTPTFEKQVMPDGSYVQSPHSISEVLVRAATVKSGQPFVISAYSRNLAEYNASRADRKAPMILGGSDIAGKNERITVLLLTAMVRE